MVNLHYVIETDLLVWSPEQDADDYQVDVRVYNDPISPGAWETIYVGLDTEKKVNKAKGRYESRGRTRNSGEWGDFCQPVEFVVP